MNIIISSLFVVGVIGDSPSLHLNDDIDTICSGDSVELTCIHPILNASFFPEIFWRHCRSHSFTPSQDGNMRENRLTNNNVQLVIPYFQRSSCFSCYVLFKDSRIELTSNEINLTLETEKQPVIIQNKAIIKQDRSATFMITLDKACIKESFVFLISWCTVENEVPDVSTCNSTNTSTTDITLSNLAPNTTYQVTIAAQNMENSTIRSDTVSFNFTTNVMVRLESRHSNSSANFIFQLPVVLLVVLKMLF